MALQLSVAAQDALLAALISTIGPAPLLQIRAGAQPASCAAGDSGTLLATMTLPSTWLSDPAADLTSLVGTWQAPSAAASGTAEHWRVLDDSLACHLQGSVSAVGGGGDLILDSTEILAGQMITIVAFSIAAANS